MTVFESLSPSDRVERSHCGQDNIPITPDKIVVSIILYPDIVSFSFGVETLNCCTFCDDTDVADKFIPDWLFTDSLFDSIFTAVFDSIFTLFAEVSDSISTVFIGTLSTVLTSSVTFDLFPRNPTSSCTLLSFV